MRTAFWLASMPSSAWPRGHGLRVIPVIFDSVWNPSPRAGPQPEPKKGVHNAGWVQSPGVAVLREPARFAALEGYVRALVAPLP